MMTTTESPRHDQPQEQRDGAGSEPPHPAASRSKARGGKAGKAPAEPGLGSTELNQDDATPAVVLDADDQAQAREALEMLDQFEAESGETLDRLIEISRRLNRSTAYALRQTNGERNNKFRALQAAWLKAAGCLKHRILKHKGTRSVLLKFAQEEYEPGLRQFWATLSPHERMKLHHPVSIWNRNVEYHNALAGIAKYKVQVQAYYEGLDEDDRTYIVVEFMPDTDEEDERARLLVEPVPEDDDEPADDEEPERVEVLTFDQMCQRPVKLWSDFCKHIDDAMSYGGMGSELEKWWGSAKNRQPIFEALEPDEQKREALKPSYKKFPEISDLRYRHYTLPLWALLWDRACQEIAAQKHEMRAWVEGLTEADRDHHLRGLSFDELTAHDPILLWQKFIAREQLDHYEDEVEEETGETGEDDPPQPDLDQYQAERAQAEQLAAAVEGIAGVEHAVDAWWVEQQERARNQQTVYVLEAGDLLHLPFDEVRRREPVALWSDYSRYQREHPEREPDEPEDEEPDAHEEPDEPDDDELPKDAAGDDDAEDDEPAEDEADQPEREQIKQALIGAIANLIYERRVDLTYADMRAVITAISTQVDTLRGLFAHDPNEPDDDDEPEPSPDGGGGGAAGASQDQAADEHDGGAGAAEGDGEDEEESTPTAHRGRRKPPPMHKATLADAIDEAFGELSGLAEEMQSWADSIPENLQGGGKYETVSETADTLAGVEQPDVPESLSGLEVEYHDLPPRSRAYSRSDRHAQACYILETCIDTLRERENDDEASELASEQESAKEEVENIEFPGMFG